MGEFFKTFPSLLCSASGWVLTHWGNINFPSGNWCRIDAAPVTISFHPNFRYPDQNDLRDETHDKRMTGRQQKKKTQPSKKNTLGVFFYRRDALFEECPRVFFCRWPFRKPGCNSRWDDSNLNFGNWYPCRGSIVHDRNWYLFRKLSSEVP